MGLLSPPVLGKKLRGKLGAGGGVLDVRCLPSLNADNVWYDFEKLRMGYQGLCSLHKMVICYLKKKKEARRATSAHDTQLQPKESQLDDPGEVVWKKSIGKLPRKERSDKMPCIVLTASLALHIIAVQFIGHHHCHYNAITAFNNARLIASAFC